MPELESFGGHCAFLRVSNEPCADRMTDRQRELFHELLSAVCGDELRFVFKPLSDPESGARAGRDIEPCDGDRDGSRLRQYFLFQSAVPTGVRNDTAAVPDETERSGKITSEIVCL